MGNGGTETKSLKLGLCTLTLWPLYQGGVVTQGWFSVAMWETRRVQVRTGAHLQVLKGMENTQC